MAWSYRVPTEKDKAEAREVGEAQLRQQRRCTGCGQPMRPAVTALRCSYCYYE